MNLRIIPIVNRVLREVHTSNVKLLSCEVFMSGCAETKAQGNEKGYCEDRGGNKKQLALCFSFTKPLFFQRLRFARFTALVKEGHYLIEITSLRAWMITTRPGLTRLHFVAPFKIGLQFRAH